jgi:heterotetrameric sarcosine oxidase delta subunit
MRKNPKGVHYERWMHAKGCRRYFNVARNTVTHEILAVYEMGKPAPTLDPALVKEPGR